MSPPKTKRKRPDQPRPEYQLDYAVSKPNRFAVRIPEGALAILLDPDVAQVFNNAESVNAVLRALMATMPQPRVPLR